MKTGNSLSLYSLFFAHSNPAIGPLSTLFFFQGPTPFTRVWGGGGQGLALIFIPAGGGALPPAPPPPPPSAQVHPKTRVLGTCFSYGKFFFGACHTLCTYCSMCAPYTLFPDYHAPTLVVSVFQLPSPTVVTRNTKT